VERHRGFDEEKLVAVLLADAVETDHGDRDSKENAASLCHISAPARERSGLPEPSRRWRTGPASS
jgi:hypothetical protein